MLYVSAYVAEARGARMRFTQDVRRNDEAGDVVCEGSAEVACMDVRGGKPRRLPEALLSELTQ
jgi:acyl-CoA thioesterase FadM